MRHPVSSSRGGPSAGPLPSRPVPPGEAPSIRARLANALAVWSLVWGVAVGLAVWAAASYEVDELMDETLESSAELLGSLTLPMLRSAAGEPRLTAEATPDVHHYAWQVVDAQGTVVWRSDLAPDHPWRRSATPGFSHSGDWRLFGRPLAPGGPMLYVAQSQEERDEARLAVALGAVGAALVVSLIGHVGLRKQVRRELQPLQTLSDQVSRLDVGGDAVPASLAPAERQELRPLTDAIEALATRLSDRLGAERAFSAHAAHALRTPLAGIDAQLAVLLKEAPQPLRERLQRVRGGAARLQAVVAALLGLFRASTDLQRQPVDLPCLVARLPVAGLSVRCLPPAAPLVADEDLLAAALSNLLDNAVRHGARQLTLELPSANCLRLADDGPGLAPDRLAALQAALDAQAYDGSTGLGLLLADRVARAHGGRLALSAGEPGLVVELDLGRADWPDNARLHEPAPARAPSVRTSAARES